MAPRRGMRILVLVALWVAQAGEAARSHLGTPLNPTGGSDATEAPIRIVRVTESEADVRLDGRLDEPVWRRLPAYDHMAVTWPDKGEPAAHRTHTFLFYTERGLYVGAWNEQPPETMVGGLSGRDVFDQLDGYQIVIDSSGNGLYGYWFRVKLGGSLMDGTLLPERRMETNWDGPWRGRTQTTDDGWTVEMFLPWAMLNMPDADGERRMAIEIVRFLARRNEMWSWPALPETEPQFISLFQPIRLEGIAAKQEVSLFPYVAGGRDIVREAGSGKAGLDVFWRPSSAFFVSGAVNPDFGQVEADDVVVNLSAFETFFPEKRLFFLESQDVFNAGDYGYRTATTLLHTRRLGPAVGSRRATPDSAPGVRYASYDTSKPVDLLLATKAAAQRGRSRYGVMVAAEDDTSLKFRDGDGAANAPGRDFGVLRYQFEDTAGGGRRALGWLATIAEHPNRRATAQAVDMHYRTSSGVWSVDSQIITSDVRSERGWGALLKATGAPRTGDQHLFSFATYDAPHWDDRASRGHGVFKLPPSWWVDARWHSPRDRKVDASVGMGWRREAMGGRNAWGRLSAAWRPSGRIRVSTGLIYENWDTWLLWQGDASFATFATERWNLNATLSAFFTARQHLEMRVQWVALKAFESSRYVVPGGTYLREVERPAVAARADFAISDLVVQLRYRWQIAPLSDLFVVYNRTGGLPNPGRRGNFVDLLDDGFGTPHEEGVLAKLRYRFGL